MGGISGLIYSSVPVVVFVLLNTLFALSVAIWGALGSAALITVVRVVRKEPLQPAISGFFGVGIAAFIAYRTGEAKGFFLFGIWASLIYGSVFLVSMLARYPLVGVIWSFLNGHGMAWRADRKAMIAYQLATLTWVAGLRRPVRGAELAVRPGPDGLAGLRPPRHGLPTDRDRTGRHGLGGHQSRPPGQEIWPRKPRKRTRRSKNASAPSTQANQNQKALS